MLPAFQSYLNARLYWIISYLSIVLAETRSKNNKGALESLIGIFLEAKGVVLLMKLIAEKHLSDPFAITACLELLYSLACLNNNAIKLMIDYLIYAHLKKLMQGKHSAQVFFVCEKLLGLILNFMTKQEKRNKRVLKVMTFYYLIENKSHDSSFYKEIIASNSEHTNEFENDSDSKTNTNQL